VAQRAGQTRVFKMDIKIVQNAEQYQFDLGLIQNNDFVLDDGLETAVIISLFSDRRENQNPIDRTDKRGWWADAVQSLDSELIGSKLWLLEREKATQETLNRAQSYASEALQWLVEQNIAETVEVEAVWLNQQAGRLCLQIQIAKPQGDVVGFEFNDIWENQTDGI